MNSRSTRQTIGDLLSRTSLRFHDKLAIQCGTTSWTYGEFDLLRVT